jgi:hypothetical protein
MHRESRNAYKNLVGRSEENGPLRGPKCRWEANIKMNLKEIGWIKGMDWIHLAEDRDQWWAVVNMNLSVP